jgi:nucleotide-binding universal stress UspA family protein
MVRIEKILCPVDFFSASERAVDYAIALAKNYEARLILLNVVTPVAPASYELPLNTGKIIDAMTESATARPQKTGKTRRGPEGSRRDDCPGRRSGYGNPRNRQG